MCAYPRYLPRYLISDIRNPHPIQSRYPIFRTLHLPMYKLGENYDLKFFQIFSPLPSNSQSSPSTFNLLLISLLERWRVDEKLSSMMRVNARESSMRSERGLHSRQERRWTSILRRKHSTAKRRSSSTGEVSRASPPSLEVVWCPPDTNDKVVPLYGGVYLHPRVLALRAQLPLTDFVRQVLSFYDVALTQLCQVRDGRSWVMKVFALILPPPRIASGILPPSIR